MTSSTSDKTVCAYVIDGTWFGWLKRSSQTRLDL